MTRLLDNVVWNALVGPQASVAVGGQTVRRYAPGFSPIAGFRDPTAPDFDALAALFTPGESFYTDGWAGPAPDGWRIEVDAFMFKMVWDAAAIPDDAAEGAVRLGPEHAQQALDLAVLTNPGPFGLRTLELGEYWGFFDGERLVAMAGERFQAGLWREISGVCTHPEYQGRGLAGRLMTRLIRNEVARGERPFLHVMSHNDSARRLYARLGFRDYKESPVRRTVRTG